MADFPIWMKLIVWGILGMTVLYCLWGIYQTMGRG